MPEERHPHFRISLIGFMGGLIALSAHAAQVGEMFDDWTIRCERDTATNSDQCFLSQSIAMREGHQRVLNIDIGYAVPREQAVALITLPLGISLPPGASLRVDDDTPSHFAIERCEPSGCRGGVILDAKLLQRLQTGKHATIAFFDGERHRLEVPIRLRGFAAGLRALIEGPTAPADQ